MPVVGLTIGQVARFAGVSTKTVRHYHRMGLIAEPARDRSGYRRYGSADLVRLVNIRAFVDAGVALSRIGELLDADGRELRRSLVDIEHMLDDRIAELAARRDMLRRLAIGDRGLVPERARAFLDRLLDVGFPLDYVDVQREGLTLTFAVHPRFAERLLVELERRFEDPGYVALQQRAWAARPWSADDPRLDELASDLVDDLLRRRGSWESQTEYYSVDRSSPYQLINTYGSDESPALARLDTLVEDMLRTSLRHSG